MTTAELATAFANLCKAGKFDEAGAQFWSDDIVSIEADGPDPSALEARGIAAVKAKGEWWYANHEIHSVEAHGPFVNGEQFIVRFKMDVTMKASGQRMQMNEDGLYTVSDGKIVEERFFYGG
jgi:ketosteroid isomerase-like protein